MQPRASCTLAHTNTHKKFMTLAQWEDVGGLDEPGRDDEGRLTEIIQAQKETQKRLLTGAEPQDRWRNGGNDAGGRRERAREERC